MISDVTAAVHYLTFNFTDVQVNQLAFGSVFIVSDQPSYLEVTALSDATPGDLLTDSCS